MSELQIIDKAYAKWVSGLKERYQQSRVRASMATNPHQLAFVDKLDMVIFAGVEHIEIIKLAEIPSMLKLMPWTFFVAAGPTIERICISTV